MFITNFSETNINNAFVCGERLGKYIQKNYGITPLSIQENGEYVFSKTNELEKVKNELPFFVRRFYK